MLRRGLPAWNVRPEVVSTLVATLAWMTQLMMHVCRLAEEGWAEWQGRTWRGGRSMLTKLWGGAPALIFGACAVDAVARPPERPACLVVGRIIHWRSGVGVETMRSIAGGRLGVWSRPRTRRSHRRWEERVSGGRDSHGWVPRAARRAHVSALCSPG